jgi:hypothetical protein
MGGFEAAAPQATCTVVAKIPKPVVAAAIG